MISSIYRKGRSLRGNGKFERERNDAGMTNKSQDDKKYVDVIVTRNARMQVPHIQIISPLKIFCIKNIMGIFLEVIFLTR